jgi:hypothetical protein
MIRSFKCDYIPAEFSFYALIPFCFAEFFAQLQRFSQKFHHDFGVLSL